MAGKFYWLKLKKDFFKRHDIRILESMPNGKEFLLILLKLMTESIDHDGALRFSDSIPYDAKMLAAITDTSEAVMKESLDVFGKLELVIQKDGTFFVSMVADGKLVGSAADNENANRQRRWREAHANDSVMPPLQNVTHAVTQESTNPNESIENKRTENKRVREKEKLKREKATTTSRFVAPSLEEVQEYCRERNNDVDAERFISYYQSNGWMVGRNHMKDWKATIRTWERRNKESGFSGKQTKPDVQTMNEKEPAPKKDGVWDGVTMPLPDRIKWNLSESERRRYDEAYLDWKLAN